MPKKRASVSRREFICRGVAGATALLSASSTVRPPGDPVKVRGACHPDCPDTCAWIVTTEKGEAVALEGDPEHPMTRGRLCEKMDGFLTDVVYNPERVLYPLKRVSANGEGRLERVSWDEALDAVAARLRNIIDEHGAEAVVPYSYAGTIGMVQSWSLDRRFFSRLGATRLERTICGNTGAAGLQATLGTSTGILPKDLVDSRFLIMWGGNPVVTNPHGWLHVEQARAAGARLVVIDPLRSPTQLRVAGRGAPYVGDGSRSAGTALPSHPRKALLRRVEARGLEWMT